MTKEEAIRHIESIKPYVGRNIKDALDMATKALEQDTVLSEIRAEIVQIPTISFNANDIYKADVLQIIDKYRVKPKKIKAQDNVQQPTTKVVGLCSEATQSG